MMGKLKGMKDKAKAKVDDAKAQHEEKQHIKWSEEVHGEGGRFKNFEGWADQYEPKKDKKEKEAGGPNAVQRAAQEKMTKNVSANIERTLMEVVSKLLGPASEALLQADKETSDVLNAANAAALTYRFEKHGAKRMSFIRGRAAERLAVTLVAALDKESAAQGAGDAAKLDPEALKKVVDSLTAKVSAVVEQKQADAVAAIKESPLFAASGADGAQVDAGIVALQDFLRGYMESKIGHVITTLNVVLDGAFKIAAKHAEAIKKHASDAAAGPDEAFTKASGEVLAEIEGAHTKLDEAVRSYVGDLVGLAMGGGGDEAAE